MKKVNAIGLLGFALYAVGFIWQIKELIRNLITDKEETSWAVFVLLTAVVVAMVLYIIMFWWIFVRNKFYTARRLIISMVSSLVVLLWFGWMIIKSVPLVPQYLIYSKAAKIDIWLKAILAPSLFLFLGALLILTMSVIFFIAHKNQK